MASPARLATWLGKLLAFGQGLCFAVCSASEQLTGTTDFVFGVTNHFVQLGNPAHGACQSEDAGEQVHWNADGALHDA